LHAHAAAGAVAVSESARAGVPARAAVDPGARRVVVQMVSLLHEYGALVAQPSAAPVP
jgi:hypothetical protein